MTATEAWPKLISLVSEEKFKERELKKYLYQMDARSVCGSTPLHFAILSGNIKTVNFLLENDALVNEINQYGETALHWACKEGTTKMVDLLIEFGADCNAIDGEKKTPLHWAAEYNSCEIAKILVKFGARQRKDINGKIPLQIAKKNSSTEIYNYLKKKTPRLGLILSM